MINNDNGSSGRNKAAGQKSVSERRVRFPIAFSLMECLLWAFVRMKEGNKQIVTAFCPVQPAAGLPRETKTHQID
jgi:hypothetical protein